MKKVFKLKDLDCANCAAKMEKAISELPGVASVRVNFLTQKLTLEADAAQFDTLLEKASAIIRKIEPDCTVIK
ncbi:MAG: cation transporter [Clostridia bacterium]|nr:cation transporter [Clostridia bacterium]